MDRKEKLQQLVKRRSGTPASPPGGTDPGSVGTAEAECRHSAQPLDSSHGCVRLDSAQPVSPQLFHLAGLPLSAWGDRLRITLLDAETTGLAGGTGTYMFLMGLASLSPDSSCLLIRQHFLPALHAEAEFLGRIRAELAASDLLVCFNGKSYDLPLLQTRLRMNRLPLLPAGMPVLDLLFPARRYWRPLLGSCTLQNLEREALGFARVGDLPGAFVPELYFRYLRGANRETLEPVFEHNRLDLIGMAALQSLLNRKLSLEDELDERALECLLRCLLDRRRFEEFLRLHDLHAARWHEAARRNAELGRALAFLCKRTGLREEAHEIFLHLSDARPRVVPESLEEVLMYEEHVRRDAAAALQRCEEFLALVESWPDRPDLAARLHHRRQRLLRKL